MSPCERYWFCPNFSRCRRSRERRNSFNGGFAVNNRARDAKVATELFRPAKLPALRQRRRERVVFADRDHTLKCAGCPVMFERYSPKLLDKAFRLALRRYRDTSARSYLTVASSDCSDSFGQSLCFAASAMFCLTLNRSDTKFNISVPTRAHPGRTSISLILRLFSSSDHLGDRSSSTR